MTQEKKHRDGCLKRTLASDSSKALVLGGSAGTILAATLKATAKAGAESTGRGLIVRPVLNAAGKVVRHTKVNDIIYKATAKMSNKKIVYISIAGTTVAFVLSLAGVKIYKNLTKKKKSKPADTGPKVTIAKPSKADEDTAKEEPYSCPSDDEDLMTLFPLTHTATSDEDTEAVSHLDITPGFLIDAGAIIERASFVRTGPVHAQGTFTKVHFGTLTVGGEDEEQADVDVVIKSFAADVFQGKQYVEEAILGEISQLSGKSFPADNNLIEVYGICAHKPKKGTDDEKKTRISILMEKGDMNLEQFMSKVASKEIDLTPALVKKLISDVANAVATLHENDIIHGAIRPSNVIVFVTTNDEGEIVITCKLTDYGLGKFETFLSMQATTTTKKSFDHYKWCCPYLASGAVRASKETDLHGLAMIALILGAGTMDVCTENDRRLYGDKLKHRPEQASTLCDPEIYREVVEPCYRPIYKPSIVDGETIYQRDPSKSKRSARQVHQYLQGMPVVEHTENRQHNAADGHRVSPNPDGENQQRGCVVC